MDNTQYGTPKADADASRQNDGDEEEEDSSSSSDELETTLAQGRDEVEAWPATDGKIQRYSTSELLGDFGKHKRRVVQGLINMIRTKTIGFDDKISWNPKTGTLIHNDVEQKTANIKDLLHYMFQTKHSPAMKPAFYDDFKTMVYSDRAIKSEIDKILNRTHQKARGYGDIIWLRY